MPFMHLQYDLERWKAVRDSKHAVFRLPGVNIFMLMYLYFICVWFRQSIYILVKVSCTICRIGCLATGEVGVGESDKGAGR